MTVIACTAAVRCFGPPLVATCGGTRSTIRKYQHSDILQPPSLETLIACADGGRSCIYGARPDDQLHDGLRPSSPFWPSAVWRSVEERHSSDSLQPSPLLHHWAPDIGGRMGHARLTGLSLPSTSATHPRISIHRQLDN